MKKLLTFVSAVAVAATLSTGAMAEKTLRITLQLPLKSHLGQNLLSFKKEVEAKSNGDLKVEIYDSAQLYKDKEVPQAVSSGAIEMGSASITRYAGTVPAVDIFYVPFMFNTEDLVRKATAPGSPVRGPIDDAILKTGARVLWWQAYGGAIMLSKDGPLKAPTDIQDKKVRVFGKTLGAFVETLGGAPTLISGSEQYLAYQRGTVDAGMTGISGVKSRKLWQVMDWVTVTNHADVEFLVLVNEKFWQSLSDDERAIVQTAAHNAESSLRDRVSQIEADAYAASEDAGMKVQRLNAQEIEAWRAAAKPVLEEYKKAAGPLGEELAKAAESLR
ncbi:TRAP transporter substrate-binding protein [Aestuariispira ectoiniformans]|uniref:TRAP transporter substrate-binding protein n=1 Tax=Aestuariispira ectoiniformans TaxID=2775080 RepID=UPI00223BB917|nr:TRAP transporter substrate-binding protein DctP [Aestuariispira ectoiniformans]